MESLRDFVDFLAEWVLNKGITVNGETISFSIIAGSKSPTANTAIRSGRYQSL